MHRRARAPVTRPLTPDEIARTRLLIDDLWPGRIVAQQYVEWDRYLIIDWLPGGGPVTQVRLPIAYLDGRTTTPVRAPTSDDLPSPSYRQDRSGEPWHIIPPNEHGTHGRALCGEPRQGTRLSESHAEWATTPPQRLCPSCREKTSAATRKDSPNVQLSPA
jgi:hypothetical protein